MLRRSLKIVSERLLRRKQLNSNSKMRYLSRPRQFLRQCQASLTRFVDKLNASLNQLRASSFLK